MILGEGIRALAAKTGCKGQTGTVRTGPGNPGGQRAQERKDGEREEEEEKEKEGKGEGEQCPPVPGTPRLRQLRYVECAIG